MFLTYTKYFYVSLPIYLSLHCTALCINRTTSYLGSRSPVLGSRLALGALRSGARNGSSLEVHVPRRGPDSHTWADAAPSDPRIQCLGSPMPW